MELNEYVLEMLVRDRLREARAECTRRALRPRPPRPALRARLGVALIRLGERLAGPAAPRLPSPRESHG